MLVILFDVFLFIFLKFDAFYRFYVCSYSCSCTKTTGKLINTCNYLYVVSFCKGTLLEIIVVNFTSVYQYLIN